MRSVLPWAITAVWLAVAPELIDEWSAPEACGAAAQIEATTEEFLSRPLSERELEQVVIEGSIEAEEPGYRAWVHVQTPMGETTREVEAETCQAIVEASAIIIAVALDPVLVAESVEPVREAPSPVESTPRPREPSDSEPGQPEPGQPEASEPETSFAESSPRDRPFGPDARTPVSVAGLVAGGLDLGTVGDLAGGARAGLVLRRNLLRIELVGGFVGPVAHRPFVEAQGAGVRVLLGYVQLGACVNPAVGRFEFPICAIFETGAVRGTGIGLDQPLTAHQGWFVAAGRAAASVRVSERVRLTLGAEGGGLLHRPAFAIDDLGTAWRAPPALLRPFFAIEVDFTDAGSPRAAK